MSLDSNVLSELSIKQIVEEKEKLEKNIEKILENFEEKTKIGVIKILIYKPNNLRGEKSIKINIDVGI